LSEVCVQACAIWARINTCMQYYAAVSNYRDVNATFGGAVGHPSSEVMRFLHAYRPALKEPPDPHRMDPQFMLSLILYPPF
jgi:hypothetical protein